MLRYNDQQDVFYLISDDAKKAVAAGLTLSERSRGPNGEKIWYSSDTWDRDKMVYNPYSVLEFWDEADGEAKTKLAGFHADYTASWAKTTSYVAPHPPTVEPMSFQNAGVEFCLGRQHSLIGDAMGLGKTIMGILLANAMEARRILVVCPASIRRQWGGKIHEWSTLRRPDTQLILNGKSGVHPHVNYTVVSYDLLRNPGIHAALRGIRFDLGLWDEAHYMKTMDADRTRAIFGGGTGKFENNGLCLNVNRMVGLTGTALPNRPREAYTLTRGFCWDAIDYMAYEPFCFRYNPSEMKVLIDPNTGEPIYHTEEQRGRMAEMNARLRCNLMVRRLPEDVLEQLPDKRYELTYIEPDGAIKDVLKREALIDFDPRELFNPDFTLDGTPISTLRREMGEAMVPSVVRYVRDLLDITEVPKIVLYAHHRDVVAMLAEALGNYGVVIHQGGMTDSRKAEARHDFIHGRPGIHPRIFLGQLDTMEGVDELQSVCSVAVFAEPAWTSGRNEQCLARLYRHGQHDNVLGIFLLAQGSFNEKVLNLMLGKAQDLHAIMDRRLV